MTEPTTTPDRPDPDRYTAGLEKLITGQSNQIQQLREIIDYITTVGVPPRMCKLYYDEAYGWGVR